MKNALALGTFDGVHVGHERVLDIKGEYNKTAVAFAVPPKAYISGEPLAILSPQKKEEVLKKCGINNVFFLEFEKVKNQTAEEFLLFLKEKFAPSLISCGFNYRFGKNALGDAGLLNSFCKENNVEFRCCDAVSENGVTVSSTQIRGFLKNGEIKKANALMKTPFSYTAEVVSGDRRGRTIGFPTVNQRYPELLVPIKFGVYKTAVVIDGREYEGITNIGMRPTFKTEHITSETFIKNFSSDVYGKIITVYPKEFIRGEIKFSSVCELKKQIELDIKR